MWLVSKRLADEGGRMGVTMFNIITLFPGLLESDTQRIIMGNRDWAQYIAEDLGY
jgi:hypothetical protein